MINNPISEHFRVAAKDWVEADRAASLMEETKTIIFSQIVGKIITDNLKLPVNKAELAAKTSAEYREFVTEMVELRSKANLLKVKMEYLRMQHSEQMSREATARAETRL